MDAAGTWCVIITKEATPVLGPLQLPIRWVRGALFAGVKWPLREARQSHLVLGLMCWAVSTFTRMFSWREWGQIHSYLKITTFCSFSFCAWLPKCWERGYGVRSWSLHSSDMGWLTKVTVPTWKSDVTNKLFHISEAYVIFANIKCTWTWHISILISLKGINLCIVNILSSVRKHTDVLQVLRWEYR